MMGDHNNKRQCTTMIIIVVVIVVSPLHPTFSVAHPNNIPTPADKRRQARPHHPCPATTDYNHDQPQLTMTMQQPHHDTTM
jgi:hypothetical protein